MTDSVLEIASPLCFWKFQEPAGSERVAVGKFGYALREGGPPVERVEGGVFGPYAARFGPGRWLEIQRRLCPGLNVHGVAAQLSVVAWLKREKNSYGGCQAVAGMWNEHALRQYCLFLNLHIHGSAEQVGAHVSSHGGATPGYKYCMDAAIGATVVDFERWHCVAITYDGTFARAYLDGKLDGRGDRNPFPYPGGIFDGGERGADFTVGAVRRPDAVDEKFQDHGSTVANPFCGLLGGLAIFDTALSDTQIAALSSAIR